MQISVISFIKTNKELPLGVWSPGSGNLAQTSLNLHTHLVSHAQIQNLLILF